MIFYLGTHVLSHAKRFERCFISVNLLHRYNKDNILHQRIADFVVNNWIMDSGAFTEITTYGHYRHSVKDYAKQINRWHKCGKLEMAVTQDYMCEPVALSMTGLTVKQHQELTIQRYDDLLKLTKVPILPVLQGYQPEEYVNHIDMYGDRLLPNMRVGVGSVCKRNSKPESIVNVLEAIKNKRPDLRLHGFGLKKTALENAYITSMLYSADSMAWSYAARRQYKNRNGLNEAREFLDSISDTSGKKPNQLSLIK